MIVSEYIEFLLLDKDHRTEFDCAEIFKLNPKDFKDLEVFNKAVNDKLNIDSDYKMPESTFEFSGKTWYYDKYDTWSPDQWAKMNEILNRNALLDPEQQVDVHLVALFIRPIGEVLNMNKLDDIAAYVYKMPVELFIALNNFFFANALRLLKCMAIHYLNLKNQKKKEKKLNSIGYGKTTIGILYVMGLPRMILYNIRKLWK